MMDRAGERDSDDECIRIVIYTGRTMYCRRLERVVDRVWCLFERNNLKQTWPQTSAIILRRNVAQ